MELVVHETAEQACLGAAERIAGLIADAGPRFTLGLAGGSTPRATYAALRGRATGWARVIAYMSDERWVPLDHEGCNGRMAAETLLDHVDAELVRPVWSDHMEPGDSSAFYEARLRSIHHDHRPDLVFLGMGADGHTASLFPGSPTLRERQRWFVGTEIPATGERRITATYPFLWSATRLLVLAVGEHKAEALRDSFAGETPAGRLGEGDAEVEWHVDRPAAALLG